ncbi:CDP-glucose 4,6-dehydratase [Tardiphaga sp. OK246]|uniref:CDP-glucose 4,6-dehydratase n=1 Tax=Tardiphaga sp. OK246 TaxID=1855307 RepID=UPI000B7178FF|nr:CDP-glucose 4,6-dehydratase [Tardiphaga sp. OK246]SNT63943.1 CDP-glucose 4,6-dehydratase [Tardiphaga sp. OK246]
MAGKKGALARLAMTTLNPHIGRLAGRRVFLTGHTGFKGSWLVHWLNALGCNVTGYALPPAESPNLFTLSKVESQLSAHYLGDIRDSERLADAVARSRPEVVIHLAAQAVVRRSYVQCTTTWSTNVLGTVNLLDALRHSDSVAAIVVVTTDKVYDNQGWTWGYREIDALGGHDPYSASKAAAELVVHSYRKSFFAGSGPRLASARGGNVIGGGDWSEDRLLADAARAIASGTKLIIRNPYATRPWQHVLDCLSGYLTLAGALLARSEGADSAFNFGPPPTDNIGVATLLERLKKLWPGLDWSTEANGDAPHEAGFLYLDSAKAHRELDWTSRWSLDTALAATATWYREVATDRSVAPAVTRRQLQEYLS